VVLVLGPAGVLSAQEHLQVPHGCQAGREWWQLALVLPQLLQQQRQQQRQQQQQV
jgi:hypothetical protein